MKVYIDKDLCIGCGACESVAPDIFQMKEDGLAHVVLDEVGEARRKDVEEAMGSCPSEAIKIEKDSRA